MKRDYVIVLDLECGVKRFMYDGKWGLLNERDKKITEPKYDYIFRFESDIAQIKKNRLYGAINNKGEEIIAPVFRNIFTFDRDLAIVYNGEYWGAVNMRGAKIIPTIYEREFDFRGGEYAIIKNRHGFNIIMRDGSYVLKEMYEEIILKQDGYLLKSEGKVSELKL